MDGFDVVTVGGATVDLFLLIDSSNPHFKFDSETKELSIRLGDKVVFNNADFTIGGNAANVAVGLKRLGLSTAIMAEIGNDEFSEKIINALKKEGVNGTLLKRGIKPTSFSIILNYKEDRTIFTEKPVKEHDFSFENLSTKWIYLTSLGDKWQDAFKKVSEFVQKGDTKLMFNPGGTQLDMGLSSFSYVLPFTEILIVNREEAQKLIGEQPDIKTTLVELKKMGPKIVVITDGRNGSNAVNEKGEFFKKEARETPIVSKTGAGDAYSSGFLAAILEGLDVAEAMVWGTKNAISVIGNIGAETGLLRKEEIEKYE